MPAKKLIALGFMVLSVSACAGTKANDDAVMTSSASDMVLSPVPAGQDPMAEGRLGAAAGIQPAPHFPPPNDRDLMVLTNKMAGGSVELYPMEGDVIRGRPMQAQQIDPAGMPSITEPSVTVFPLADNGPYPGQSALSGSGTAWPNDVLPRAPMTWPADNTPAAAPKPTQAPGHASIYFDHGSANLDNDDMRVVRAAAEEAKFAPVARVSVEGHASKRAGTGDPVKDSILNLKESMNRAFEVSKTMIMEGVPAEKLKTSAYGDTMPPASGDEAQARRVEVHSGAGY